jgi:protein phosphatase
MGTTLTAAYLDDSDLAVAHVGDSRAYIFRDGTLGRLTQDHSLVGFLIAQGKLTEEQAAEHPQRSIITRALGIEGDVEVDTWSYPVRAGDVVLLCSDGLTSMIDEKQIAAILQAEPNLDRAGEQLIAAANQAGGRDNITVVLFRLEDVGGADAVDEPTVVGMSTDSPPAAPTGEAGAGAGPRARGATGGTMIAPRVVGPVSEPVSGRAVGPPARQKLPSGPSLARTQGRRSEPPPRRGLGRLGKTVAALVSIAVVLFLVGAGGYLATRQLFFIGTNAQGIVTIYRGLPYDGPFGVRLYESFYTSGVPISAVPADRRATLLDHDLRSQNASISLVHAAELGQLSK